MTQSITQSELSAMLAAGEPVASRGDSALGASGSGGRHLEAGATGATGAERARHVFEALAGELSAAWGRGVEITPGEPSTADPQALSTLSAAAPVRTKALVLTALVQEECSIFADDGAVLAAAALVSGAEVGAVDEKALADYGRFTAQVFQGLQSACSVALPGGPGRPGRPGGIAIQVGSPERVEGLEDRIIEDAGQGKLRMAPFSVTAVGYPAISLTLVMPADLQDAMFAPPPAREKPAEARRSPNLQRILKINVPLIVEIARRKVTLKDILAFKPGTVLEFDKESDDLLELYACKAHIGRGEAVKVGESFGLQVLEIDGLRDVIKSLSQ